MKAERERERQYQQKTEEKGKNRDAGWLEREALTANGRLERKRSHN